MNEELRQDTIVRFCEKLTERVRTAIKVLGPKCPGFNDSRLFNIDHNLIRVLVKKVNEDRWAYSFTTDHGDQFVISHLEPTPVDKYLGNRFRLSIYEVDELYVNADIHFTKHEIDYHPSGLSTTIDPRLGQSLVNAKTWDDFDAILNSKVRWMTQVNRKEWLPSVVVQRGFDQDLELVAVGANPKHDGQSIEWHFEWDDGTTTKGYQDISTTEGRDLYLKLTSQLIECNPVTEWRAAFLSNVTTAEG